MNKLTLAEVEPLGPPLFEERQRFLRTWIGPLLLVPLVGAGVFAYGMVQQLALGVPWGDRPMSDAEMVIVGPIMILIMAAVFVALTWGEMVTQVRQDGIYLRYFPFHRRFHCWRWDEIRTMEARRYGPIREYGGWGIRGLARNRAYNVSGNHGLQLELENGHRLLLGSQRAEELAARAEEARRG